MGLMLSVLVGCVGAVELVSCLHYISDEWLLQQLRTQNREAIVQALNKYQDEIKESIQQLDSSEQNRVSFENGYRKEESEKDNEELRQRFQERLKEILRGGDGESASNTDNERTKNGTIRQNGGPSTNPSNDEMLPDIHFDEYDRPSQFSDDYLRTLDGVKGRPLVRDDGTGRRRAFKKRNSGSSSSRDSRASREEELKQFTSLEEAEFASMKSDFVPITYSSEPNLIKVKKHHRHKKHSVPDMGKTDEHDEDDDDDDREPLFKDEVGGDEVTHPWGDIKPEMRRDSDLWKRMGKESSIAEDLREEGGDHHHQRDISERDDLMSVKSLKLSEIDDVIESATVSMERSKTPAFNNIPKSDSFEEATTSQHEAVIDILKGKQQENVSDDVLPNSSVTVVPFVLKFFFLSRN